MQMTEELMARAVEVGELYEPKEGVLLVGSAVWLGEGADVDVVVYCDELLYDLGLACTHPDAPYGDAGFAAYRHGPINVIVVSTARVWAGWVHAAAHMPGLAKSGLITSKEERVRACKNLRKLGEEAYDRAQA